MRRTVSFLLVFPALICGCGRAAPTPVAIPIPPPPTTTQNTATPDATTLPPIELSADAKYDGYLADAMAQLGAGNWTAAMTAFEQAQKTKDTELVRGEIARLRIQIDAEKAAAQTAETVRFVLKQGRADEAANLAGKALEQFGGGPAADTFTVLKRQADALLVTAQDQAAQAERLQREAETAATAKNLRAALLSYEQSLAAKADAAAQQRYDDLKRTVARYDDLRDRAATVRRDAYRLEEAIDLYRQAGQVWDTPQIREDIDSCTLALQNRRERVAIADFEVRGDIGIPNAGRVIAEELIAPFRGRFDVVERQQIDKVIGELKVEGPDLWNADAPRREFGRIAKVRYVVLGSVTPTFGSLTINARLVETASGLVVQTAKVVAPTPTEMTKQLPRLALMLQMSDAELRTFEQTLNQQPAVPAIDPGFLPPPPPPPTAATVRPVAILPYTNRPPVVGAIVFEDFVRLPPVATTPSPASVSVVIEKDHKARLRLTSLSLELGDNLFRRGLFKEADTQFRLALSLNPGHSDIQVRLNQCQPLMPTLPPIVQVRQRLAVLDFVTPGDPAAVPPGLGPWTAELLAPYYSPAYEVVDRGQVYWFMGRLGLTLRDVIVDPAARAVLGQALNTRYFIVGTLRPTAGGLEATAHMLDAPTGQRLDLATIVARSPGELKLRLPEIARWMLTEPAVRIVRQREAEAYQTLLAQADTCVTRGQFPQAVGFYHQVLKVHPDDIRIQALAAEAERNAHRAEIESRRRVEAEQALTISVAFQKQQADLLRASEEARKQAERQAAAVADAERERRKSEALQRMVNQARTARDKQQWKESLQLYETAVGLGAAAEIIREREAVQQRVSEAQKLRLAEEATAREAALRKQREAELVRVKQQAEEERRKRETADLARRQQQEERDRVEYARLLENAKRLQDNKRYDDAIDQLNQAKRIRPGVEVEGLLSAAIASRTQSTTPAQKKAEDQVRADAVAKARAEAAQLAAAQKLAAEKAAQQNPPPLPKDQPKSTSPPLPKDQPKANTPPPLPKDQPKANTPPPLPKDEPKPTTPPPLPKDQPKSSPTPPPLPKDQPKDQSKQATPPPLPKDEPKTTPPPLSKDQPKDKAKDPAKTTPPPLPKDQPKKGPPAEYTKKMDAGAAAEKTGKFADAQQAYQDALKIVPGDNPATKRAEYAKQMDAGAKAMQAKKYADAVKAYEAALRAAPGDATANRLLQQAKTAK